MKFKINDRVFVVKNGFHLVGLVSHTKLEGEVNYCRVIGYKKYNSLGEEGVVSEWYREDELENYVENEAKEENLEEKPWIPSNKEDFYYIDECFEIQATYYQHDYKFDNQRVESGNCYKTKEQAKKVANNLKFESQVRAMFTALNGGEPLLHSSSEMYVVRVLLEGTPVVTSGWWNGHKVFPTGWHADSKEKVQKVIDHFGEEKFLAWAKGEL